MNSDYLVDNLNAYPNNENLIVANAPYINENCRTAYSAIRRRVLAENRKLVTESGESYFRNIPSNLLFVEDVADDQPDILDIIGGCYYMAGSGNYNLFRIQGSKSTVSYDPAPVEDEDTSIATASFTLQTWNLWLWTDYEIA